MKAERRHELRENDLAAALEASREYLQKNGTRIALAAIIVVVVVTAVSFTVRSRAAALEDIWRRKAQLTFDDPQTAKTSLQALASMTAGADDTHFVFTSLVDQARTALSLSQQVPLPPDRELNEAARGALNELLRRFPDHPIAIGIGHNGLATVAANDFVLDGDPAHRTEAETHLKAILDNARLDGLPFKQAAAARLAALDQTFTRVVFEYPLLEEPTVEEPAEPAAAETDEQVDTADPKDDSGTDADDSEPGK